MWCTERILEETGPQLTWLALALDDFEDTTVHRLEQLHSLRELTVRNFGSHDMFFRYDVARHADSSHLTVCFFQSLFTYAYLQGILVLCHLCGS